MSQRKLVRNSDVMTNKFVMVDGLHTVADAVKHAIEQDVKVLFVNKRHENDEYGIVLMSDIAKQVLAKDRAPERVNIYEIMLKPVLSVSAGMDVRYCARLFERLRISKAPVIENGEILGLVSYQDLVLKGMMAQI
ncbi:CBS domain-containing protein [Shewanella hanedai]|uniref:CBS domain-containing protein n=1 Tax=Shewanella hanedai TaxID=25 RepID=A0A553JG20_SHEHA|nr:CBS domain-containing protein [Shewanella hanedai]TRY11396.1 CBS domain-containing protein [Shewanella hanedai]GGJ03386.1 CBS domain-containing protein [Shewanella hanedai]